MRAAAAARILRPSRNGSPVTDPAVLPQLAPRRRVLVVDDEDRIRQVLVRILRARGIGADAASGGSDAVAMTASGSYDLVILDLLMPGQDGFSALAEIMRRRPDQAVLVLSCLADPESKMATLGLGADDYVPKPFHVGELVARVQARLRAAARAGVPVLECGQLRLDVLRRQADAGGGPVPLTSREFQLLWELMHEPGAVVSKGDLLAHVWDSPPDSPANVVDVYIRRLRSRLGTDAITTVRGEGYRVGPG
jgi:two-component system, OmpR family, copper resistance phosphate regulon response regulator CusR